MDYSATYRDIQNKIRALTDEEVMSLLSFVQLEVRSREHMAHYDPAQDPFLKEEGLFSGDPDLSERVKEILYEPVKKVDESAS